MTGHPLFLASRPRCSPEACSVGLGSAPQRPCFRNARPAAPVPVVPVKSYSETLFRRGQETRLLLQSGPARGSQPDPALVKAVARAHSWFEDLTTGRASSIREIAQRDAVTDRCVSQL